MQADFGNHRAFLEAALSPVWVVASWSGRSVRPQTLLSEGSAGSTEGQTQRCFVSALYPAKELYVLLIALLP